jgi:KDO2-lipid IV(A) lauroyltransferase
MGRRPLVLLCPHFVGLEAAAQRLSLEGRMVTLYRPSSHAAFDKWRRASRSRFNEQLLTPLGAPLAATIRAVRQGMPLFLLPDLDPGASGALFSPFFGVSAATVRTTAWCAAVLGATVLPVSVHRVGDDRYVTTVHAPLALEGRDLQADTDRVNQSIQALVARHPQQYWWCQPRFATRPGGAPACYSSAVLQRAANEQAMTSRRAAWR